MLNEKMIKVSVIIPVYDAQEYLTECIQSIQSQTMKEIEIICVDDGSIDTSLHILREFQREDNCFHIFQQTNQGAGAARNLALKNAQGEYVCFLDADDYWIDDTALEKLYNCAKQQQGSICGGQYYMEKNGSIGAVNIYSTLYDSLENEQQIKYTAYQYDFNYTNYLYRRSLLMENRIFFPQYRRFEDPPFFVKAMYAAGIFCVVDVPFYCYRVGYKETQYTVSMMADHMQGMIDNLHFSGQKQLKKLHRLTYYRILEICNREFKHFVAERNAVLLQKLNEANDMIHWEWLEEFANIKEHILRPLMDVQDYHDEKENLEKWVLPVRYFAHGSKIALYGAGDVGRSYFRQLQRSEGLHLCAWADINYNKITETSYKLISPEQLVTIDFDYIVIGAAEIVMAMEIMDTLMCLEIPAGKIIWDLGR